MICHSGGCPGSDMTWENEGKKYDIKTIAYSFYNHVQEGENPKLLTFDELKEGWEHVLYAERTLDRKIERIQIPYVRHLLCRNWFQVKNSDTIFAIGKFIETAYGKEVDGGTGWAVQMAIDNSKPIYFFEQNLNSWFEYSYKKLQFRAYNSIPTLTENFAGIGTRAINENGINAIKEVLKSKV